MEAGDTQWMPSQVIQDYLSNQSKATTAALEGKQGTYAAGDTGFIELTDCDAGRVQLDASPSSMSSQQSEHSRANRRDGDRQSDAISEEAAYTSQNVSPTARFDAVTPVAGKKHDRRGNTIVESATTKSDRQQLEAWFATSAKHNRMGMTQLFRNTQASSSQPTSPTNIRSDPVFARPSPDVRNATCSSPAVRTSSPLTVRKPGRPVQATEPREAYLPLHESQRQRNATSDGSSSPSLVHSDEELNEMDATAGEIALQRKRRRQLIERDALAQFRSFAAPASVKPGQTRRFLSAQTMIRLMTPRDKEHLWNGKEVITISSDKKTPRNAPSDDDNASADGHEVFSQMLMPSDRKPDGDLSWSTPSISGKEHGRPRPNSSPVPGKYGGALARSPRKLSGPPSKQPTPITGDCVPKSPGRREAEHSACVANSQPEESVVSAVARRPFMPSSITSRGFVSQSQLPAYSSLVQDDKQDLVSKPRPLETSSIPPAPYNSNDSSPSPRGRDLDTETPASSPPIPGARVAVLNTVDGSASRQVNPSYHNTGIASLQNPNTICTASSDQSKENQPPKMGTDEGPDQGKEAKVLETSPIASSRSQHTGGVLQAEATKVNDAGRNGMLSGRVIEPSDEDETYKTAPSTLTPQRLRHGADWTTPQVTPHTPGSIHRPGIKSLTDMLGPGTSIPPSDPMDMDDITLTDDGDKAFEAAMSESVPEKHRSKRVRTTYSRTRPNSAARGANLALSASYPRMLTNDVSKGSQSQPIFESVAHSHSAHNNLTSSSPTKLQSPPPVFPTASKNVAAYEKASTRGRLPAARKFTDAIHIPNADVSKIERRRSESDNTRSTPLRLEIPTHASRNDQTAQHHALLHKSATPAFPTRVLAMFKGLKHAFYPATCLGTVSASSSTLRIKFDDGSEGPVEPHLVKRLELREGDLVKIDVPGKKNTIFTVCGLMGPPANAPEHSKDGHGCDVYGHHRVVLEPRSRLSGPTTGQVDAPTRLTIDLENIYITTSLFTRLKDRTFSCQRTVDAPRLDTPIDRIATPGTPSTRNKKDGTAFEEVAASSTISFTGAAGVFSNMAFCVSFSSDKDSEKARIIQAIRENGGQVLDEGFDQLFDRPTSVPTTPAKDDVNQAGNAASLELRNGAKDVGFVALIADRHSRRIKYLQALALNLPCLHGRWILDSVQNASPRPFAKYLLPAGESAFLDGALLSRAVAGSPNISAVSPAKLKLAELIEHRPQLLKGKSVMLVIGSGKLGQRRGAYTFLTRAARPRKVEKVKDIPAARAVLKDGNQWDYIFVEDTKVAEARKKLLMNVKGPVEKRLDGTNDQHSTSAADAPALPDPKVVGDETALQSFILGEWIDDD